MVLLCTAQVPTLVFAHQPDSVCCEVSAKLAPWPGCGGRRDPAQPVKQPLALQEKVHFHLRARCDSYY